MKIFRSGGIREEWSPDPLAKTAAADELAVNPLYEVIKDLPIKTAEDDKPSDDKPKDDKPKDESAPPFGKKDEAPKDEAPKDEKSDKSPFALEAPVAPESPESPLGEGSAPLGEGTAEQVAVGKAEVAIDAAKAAIEEVKQTVTECAGEGKPAPAEGVAPVATSELPPIDELHIELDEPSFGGGLGAEIGIGGDIPGVVEEPHAALGKETCASSEPKFEKIAKLSPDNKKKLGEYWRSVYPPELHGYVDAMLRDYES